MLIYKRLKFYVHGYFYIYLKVTGKKTKFSSPSLKFSHILNVYTLQAVTASDHSETSPAKLTGTTDKQVVAQIGQKRVLFYCEDELCENIQEIIPKKVMIKYANDRLLSFENLD